MKPLSDIILEESIRISLNEFKLKPKPEDSNKPKPTTTNNKLDRKKALKIAQAIYRTKGVGTFGDDDEKGLVTAFKSIPNMATFWKVNKILTDNRNQSISKYISTYINSRETDVWIPLIKHLLKINATDIVLKTYISKTKWDSIKKEDPKLAQTIIKKKLITGGVKTDQVADQTADGYLYLTYISIGLFLMWKGKPVAKSVARFFSKNQDIKQSQAQPYRAGEYSLRTLTGLAKPNFLYLLQNKSFWNMSKNKMMQLLKIELREKRLSKQEYDELYVVLSEIKSSDINKVYFNLVLKALKRRDSDFIRKGNVKRIIKMIDNKQFTKFGLQLQAIEDDILSDDILSTKSAKQDNDVTKVTTADDIMDDVDIIKQMGSSIKTTNFKSYNMDRWIRIQDLIGNKISINGQLNLKKIGNEFVKIQPTTSGGVTESTKKAILNVLGKSGESLQSIFKKFPDVKYWHDWMLKTKSGNKVYKFYNTPKFKEFPTYERWALAMKQIGVKNYTKQDYDIAHYNWKESRTL
jgi:hypothetical protein